MEGYKPERGPEKVPTKEAVLAALTGSLEGIELRVSRELSDENGLVLLEVERETDVPGEVFEYNYIRRGKHKVKSGETEKEIFSASNNIDVTRYQDGVPVEGNTYADYNESTGTWRVLK